MTRDTAHPRPSRLEALAWTAGLSAIWIAVYSACNLVSSFRTDVRVLQFEWEKAVPFVPWLIVPYLSIDLFFVTAPFLSRTRQELHVLVARLLAATLIAAFCFLAVPMTLAAERPCFDGWLGGMYDLLKAGDRPHNMCPSLHVALLLLLWPVYHCATRGVLRATLYLWFTLVLVSVLPVYQHHFIDIIGGAIVAIICLIAFPESEDTPWFQAAGLVQRRRIARRYALASIPLVALGIVLGPWGIIPGWIGGSLLLVACIYWTGSPEMFRKRAGRLPLGTRVVLAPYLLGLHFSRRLYARHAGPACSRITPTLLIGGRATRFVGEAHMLAGVVAVVDLTAEHDECAPFRVLPCLSIPLLDLVAPSVAACLLAAAFIDHHARRGTVYMHCGLGYSRSATIAAAYLIHSGRAADVEDACKTVQRLHPDTRIGVAERDVLVEFASMARRVTIS